MPSTNLTIQPASWRWNGWLCAILVFTLTNLLPHLLKTWFVEPTGSIQVAPMLGIVIALGLVWQKSWAHLGGMLLAVSLITISVWTLTGRQFGKPGYWLMLGLATVLLWRLLAHHQARNR